jgi:hypothetical protein
MVQSADGAAERGSAAGGRGACVLRDCVDTREPAAKRTASVMRTGRRFFIGISKNRPTATIFQ